jgi:hypothetical protein
VLCFSCFSGFFKQTHGGRETESSLAIAKTDMRRCTETEIEEEDDEEDEEEEEEGTAKKGKDRVPLLAAFF